MLCETALAEDFCTVAEAAFFCGFSATAFFSLDLDFGFASETDFLETVFAEEAASFEAVFCAADFLESAFAAEMFDFPPITYNYSIELFFLQARFSRQGLPFSGN